MATLILEYNARNNVAQSIIDMIKRVGVFSIKETSRYNPDFVRTVQENRQAKGTVINTKDLWK